MTRRRPRPASRPAFLAAVRDRDGSCSSLLPAVLTFRYAFTDFTGLGEGRVHRPGQPAAACRRPVLRRLPAGVRDPRGDRRAAAAAGRGRRSACCWPRRGRGGRWYRLAVYLPTVIPDIALALLFLWVLNPIYGPLNQLLGAVRAAAAGLAGRDRWGARIGRDPDAAVPDRRGVPGRARHPAGDRPSALRGGRAGGRSAVAAAPAHHAAAARPGAGRCSRSATRC